MRKHLMAQTLRYLMALGMTFWSYGTALAACSSYLGRVVFNEVFDPASGSAFLEIKTLDSTVVSDSNNFSGWKIAAYKNNSATKSEVDLSSVFTNSAKNSCGVSSAWIKVPDADIGGYINNANPGSNLNFVIYETAGAKIVDILRLGSASSFYGAGTNYASCPAIESALPSSQYDAAWGINGNKDWYRTSDGTGAWGGQGTSNNSDTSCANNDTGTTVSAPAITTTAATSVSSTGVTLNGTVYPYNATTTVSFDYGTSSNSYSSSCDVGTKTGTTVQTFSCSLTGLVCGTTYYFRAKGVNSGGTTYGSQLSTTTTPCASISGFSAYESNINNTNAAVVANRVITTRVASTSGNLCPNGLSTTASSLPTGSKTCSLTIAGFSSGAVATTYSGTVTVKLQYCSNVSRSGSGTSSTVTCGGTWTDLSAAQSVTLASGVGVATFSNISNVYEAVRVHINSSALSITSYSDDYFSIRPSGLTVTATDATASTAGSTRSLTGGAYTHKAGQPFTLNAKAYVTSSATTASNYRGTGAGPVSQTVSTTSPTGTGLVNGTLVPGTWSGSGTVTSSTANYSEVGTFNLTLEDQDYANVDKADGSSTAERYFSGSASLGRFTPDHFATVVTKSCGSFTYSGQPFSVEVTAYNGLSTPSATKNYALTSYTVTLSDAGTVTYLTNNSVSNIAPVTVSLFSVATGIATATPIYTFNPRTTVPTPITVRAIDTDTISSSGYESAATNTIVSGRLSLLNAYGSERLALPLVTRLEYYDTATSAGWRPSSGTSYADTCTSLVANNFAFSTSASNCTTATSNCISAVSVDATLNSGLYKSPWTVKLGVPTNVGSTCVALNLDGAAVGNRCTATGTTNSAADTVNTNGGASASWLKYPWTSTTATNPTARATFGIYKSPLIYRRENY